jgi:hypothetical protein
MKRLPIELPARSRSAPVASGSPGGSTSGIGAVGTDYQTVSNSQSIVHAYAYTLVSGTGMRYGVSGTGLGLTSGEILLNGSSGASASIAGGHYGVRFSGGAGSVVNAGTIAGTGTYTDNAYVSGTQSSHGAVGIGVLLDDGGVVQTGEYGATSAIITGTLIGVEIAGGAGLVDNDGEVVSSAGYGRYRVTRSGTLALTGSAGSGIVLLAGGTVTNGASDPAAMVSGAQYGVRIAVAGGVVDNDATIVGRSNYTDDYYTGASQDYPVYGYRGVGVALGFGGSVTNAAGATIVGGAMAVSIGGQAGTVVNAGTILANYSNSVGAYFTSAGSGISLAAGGTVTNGGTSNDGARIVGYGRGVAVSGGVGTVANYGTIASAGYGFFGWAISLAAGGTVINGSAIQPTRAVIYGGNAGVLVAGGSGLVANYGTIAAAYLYPVVETAVALRAGGRVINGSASITSALILGGRYGVSIGGGDGMVNNSGGIEAWAEGGTAVMLLSGGYVGNAATGTIAAATGIAVSRGVGVVVNDGLVTATTAGIVFGASVTGATVLNAGSIVVRDGTAIDFGNAAALLEVAPDAVFRGEVLAGGGGNTIELLAGEASAGESIGNLSGLGTAFVGFDTLSLDSLAQWFLAGTNLAAGNLGVDLGAGASLRVRGALAVGHTLALSGSGALGVTHVGYIAVGGQGIGAGAATRTITVQAAYDGNPAGTISGTGTITSPVIDNGAIYADGGTLAFANRVQGTATIDIGAQAVLEAAWRLDVAGVAFLPGAGGELVLDSPQVITATISGFSPGAQIDLPTMEVASDSFSAADDVLTLTAAGGSAAHLHFAGSYAPGAFAFAPDGQGGTSLTLNV